MSQDSTQTTTKAEENLALAEALAFPSAQDFCTSIPPYMFIPVTELNYQTFRKFISYSGSLDIFCVNCDKPSVFKVSENQYSYNVASYNDWYALPHFFGMVARCSRNAQHEARFFFRLSKKVGIQKVGQYPSMADINSAGIKQTFRKVLSKEHYQSYSRAVGLASHGVGAGSVVYLRKIFEALIEEAHLEADGDSAWKATYSEDYDKARTVAERVRLLKNHLPSYLVEHHTMYGVLSAAVHDLSEQECLELFPVLKIGIDLILNQKIRQKEEAEQVAELKQMLHSQQSK